MDPKTGLAVQNADPGEDGELPAPVHAYAAAGQHAPRIVRRDDDTPEIECPRCHSRSPITANTCGSCGLPFTVESAQYPIATVGSEAGMGAVTTGIFALLFSMCPAAGFILGITAIIIGLLAFGRSRKGRPKAAKIGVAMGIVACLISLLMLSMI